MLQSLGTAVSDTIVTVVDHSDVGIRIDWIYREYIDDPLTLEGDPWVKCLRRFGVWYQFNPDTETYAWLQAWYKITELRYMEWLNSIVVERLPACPNE